MHTHTRSVWEKNFEVWRSPGRFTKNPDVVQTPSGKLLLVYSDTDGHWSQENQVLTILASDDLGRTWQKHAEVDRADLRKGDERMVTPRLSQLADGRLAVLIDHDDFGHFHEDQPSGNWVYWSHDEGETWDGPHVTGIRGFEPDRMMDLPDGRLAVCSHLMRGASQCYAEIISCSDDGGRMWYEQATVAHDGYHFFCEGALVVLDGGKELACVMRENHSAGIPSYVAFSSDNGRTWSEPQMMPFALHRPYAKQLADGRVLVTGRNTSGGLGTYGWCGDLHKEAGRFSVGGPRRRFNAELSADGLVIENAPDRECRYTLLPPQDSLSEVVYEARVRVEGPEGETVARMCVPALATKFQGGSTVIEIGADFVAMGGRRTDQCKRVEMTSTRTIRLQHYRGLCELLVDGEVLMRKPVGHNGHLLPDFHGSTPDRRAQFGQWGEVGRSVWENVRYSVRNRTFGNFDFAWEAASGLWPDRYQRERLIQIHANHPDQKPWPDHGYSSWLPLEDGRIFLVDYTNCGDEPGKSHLMGVYLEPEDIA